MLPIWHFETREDKCSWKARPLSRQTVKEPHGGPVRLAHLAVLRCGEGARPSFLTTELLAADSARPHPAPNRARYPCNPTTVQCDEGRGKSQSPRSNENGVHVTGEPQLPAPFPPLPGPGTPRSFGKQEAHKVVGVNESKIPSYGWADEVACVGPSGLPCYLTTGR